MRIFDKGHALRSLCPNSSWYTTIDPKTKVETIHWDDTENTQPTDVEINAEVSRLQTEYESQTYSRSRAAEYPDWGTQLDYIYHNGLDKWKTDMIDPVKTKYPKPS